MSIVSEKIKQSLEALSRNILLVQQCDQKASFILATLGVLIPLVFSHERVLILVEVLTEACKFKGFSDAIFMMLFLISLLILLRGIYCLCAVFLAKVNCNERGAESKRSLIFFTGIFQYKKVSEYIASFQKMDDDEYLRDILQQIYINSAIASLKYKYFNEGLRYSLGGLLLFVLIFICGCLIYK